ncbi:AmmeMemoRadiSam system protein B [Tepidanaerobacter sp. GT38]|uniref:AmmeMemoRadiSam system protein B n=1 Tax=Tepidanaerobacter sp. GT38 TaxID=2722793 RepID=UPI001F4273A6|nr:AmmeMemoRadiSam system protein B [Tepidanaerobacter sp. GT38]MCG1013387.1 AmmeMemoRadiSam system protein B [Tepidanaerobacter sp. GT38]
MKKSFVIFVGIFLCFALSCCSFKTNDTEEPYQAPKATHPNVFYDPRLFNPLSPEDIEPFEGRIHGAVVPHHLLAHELIGEVFAKLAKSPPTQIILLGPNHQNLGNKILTSSLAWQTPFGTVETDEYIIDELLKTKLVKQDDRPFTKEHSIGNLMPFIKYYLPDTKVVPVIFHYDVSKKEAEQIANCLSSFVDRGTAVIASVDFSHYLTRQEAEQKDQETIKTMKDKDLDKLFSLGNDHLDSPASLVTLFLTMANQGITEFEILAHTNSGILMGNDLIETTSYMTLVFKK